MADTLLPVEREYAAQHGESRRAHVASVIEVAMRHRRTPCIVHELSEPCDERGFCWRHERSDYIAERLLQFIRDNLRIAASFAAQFEARRKRRFRG